MSEENAQDNEQLEAGEMSRDDGMRYMRKINDPDHYVYPYNKVNVLSGKMVECAKDGSLINPEGVSVDNEDAQALIDSLQGRNSVLEAEIEDKNAKIEALESELLALKSGGDVTTIPPNGQETGSEGGDPDPDADEKLIEDIVDVILMLNPEDEEHYTEGGVPRTKAIEETLGQDITAEQRDAAFKVFQDAQKKDDE